jgi:hypothetical protein
VGALAAMAAKFTIVVEKVGEEQENSQAMRR